MDVDTDPSTGKVENLLNPGHTNSPPRFTVPGTEIELAQFSPFHFGYGSRRVRGAVHSFVVADNGYIVAAQPNVKFDFVRTDADRCAK